MNRTVSLLIISAKHSWEKRRIKCHPDAALPMRKSKLRARNSNLRIAGLSQPPCISGCAGSVECSLTSCSVGRGTRVDSRREGGELLQCSHSHRAPAVSGVPGTRAGHASPDQELSISQDDIVFSLHMQQNASVLKFSGCQAPMPSHLSSPPTPLALHRQGRQRGCGEKSCRVVTGIMTHLPWRPGPFGGKIIMIQPGLKYPPW